MKCMTNLHGCTGIDSHIVSLDILDFYLFVLIISYNSFVFTLESILILPALQFVEDGGLKSFCCH
ncbi:hypothetical protein Hanom_Chr17g01551701 [Helianthus anomalus]